TATAGSNPALSAYKYHGHWQLRRLGSRCAAHVARNVQEVAEAPAPVSKPIAVANGRRMLALPGRHVRGDVRRAPSCAAWSLGTIQIVPARVPAPSQSHCRGWLDHPSPRPAGLNWAGNGAGGDGPGGSRLWIQSASKTAATATEKPARTIEA